MKRKTKRTVATLRLGPQVKSLITDLSQATGWSQNVATSKLIEAGDAALKHRDAPLQTIAADIHLAIRVKGIHEFAAAKVAEAKNEIRQPTSK